MKRRLPNKIYIIVTIYEINIDDSLTIKSLTMQHNFDTEYFNVIVYDNSNIVDNSNTINDNINYVKDPSNSGLAGAYNYALSLANNQNDWICLLDQDSVLSPHFCEELKKQVNQINDDSIVAVVPHVFCLDKQVSPCRIVFGGRKSSIDQDFEGVCDFEILAINSGFAVNASFVKRIGGFNRAFWLDYLDHWLCHIIYKEGKKIFVSSSKLVHDLSVSNYNNVSEQRAQNILNSEIHFYSNYKSAVERFIYIFRLATRSLKQLVTLENKAIGLLTIKGVFRLLTTRRE